MSTKSSPLKNLKAIGLVHADCGDYRLRFVPQMPDEWFDSAGLFIANKGEIFVLDDGTKRIGDMVCTLLHEIAHLIWRERIGPWIPDVPKESGSMEGGVVESFARGFVAFCINNPRLLREMTHVLETVRSRNKGDMNGTTR